MPLAAAKVAVPTLNFKRNRPNRYARGWQKRKLYEKLRGRLATGTQLKLFVAEGRQEHRAVKAQKGAPVAQRTAKNYLSVLPERVLIIAQAVEAERIGET